MARTPDRPGTFRVKQRPDGTFLLSGVRADGSRHKMKVGSLTEGHTLGQSLFAGVLHRTSTPATGPAPVLSVTLPGAQQVLDDFGLPIEFKLPSVTDETINSATPTPAPTQTAPAPTVQLTAKTESERTKNAKSLCELAGIGYSAGVIYAANKFLEPRYEKVPTANKKQLNELTDSVRNGLIDLFGDREVGPWTMALLLTIGIPMAMWIQSSGKKVKPEDSKAPTLQSVP